MVWFIVGEYLTIPSKKHRRNYYTRLLHGFVQHSTSVFFRWTDGRNDGRAGGLADGRTGGRFWELRSVQVCVSENEHTFLAKANVWSWYFVLVNRLRIVHALWWPTFKVETSHTLGRYTYGALQCGIETISGRWEGGRWGVTPYNQKYNYTIKKQACCVYIVYWRFALSAPLFTLYVSTCYCHPSHFLLYSSMVDCHR